MCASQQSASVHRGCSFDALVASEEEMKAFQRFRTEAVLGIAVGLVSCEKLLMGNILEYVQQRGAALSPILEDTPVPILEATQQLEDVWSAESDDDADSEDFRELNDAPIFSPLKTKLRDRTQPLPVPEMSTRDIPECTPSVSNMKVLPSLFADLSRKSTCLEILRTALDAVASTEPVFLACDGKPCVPFKISEETQLASGTGFALSDQCDWLKTFYLHWPLLMMWCV
eukprot:c18612_g2_i2.p1 GENE.c18612_g2_i2~~c18612_g2_i2.p1  ORF type:complete len:228 (+),score=32.95 c18612_g2_i2:378-1061(+)